MRRILLAVVVVGLLLPGGCGKPQQKYDAVIGVSVLTFDNPFFKEVAEAIEKEAAKHNYRVDVVDGAEDPVRQDGQVVDFITKQVDAIILCPCDSEAVGASIVKANRAQIPVFTADLASMAEQGEVVCHVATDNLEGGRKAAEAVIEMLGGSGKVAVLDYDTAESVKLRTRGFREVMSRPEASGITVLGFWPGGGNEKVSADAAATVLETHPDLDAFFCVNDPSAMGAINAIKRAEETGQIKPGQIQVVGFDAQQFAREAVRNGQLHTTIVQYPKRIGRRAADAVHRHLIGEEIPKQDLIAVKTYDKTTADAIDAELKKEE